MRNTGSTCRWPLPGNDSGIWWRLFRVVDVLRGGAVDQTNLEPASLVSLLDELEEWGAVLKAEPELIHKLREFEAAASGQAKDAKKDTHKNAPRRRQPRGPSL